MLSKLGMSTCSLAHDYYQLILMTTHNSSPLPPGSRSWFLCKHVGSQLISRLPIHAGSTDSLATAPHGIEGDRKEPVAGGMA